MTGNCLLLVSAALILCLLGAITPQTSAEFTAADREELASSLKMIDDYLCQNHKLEEVEEYQTMLLASREFVESISAGSTQRAELDRALDLLGKLEWAGESCTTGAVEMLSELTALTSEVELPRLDRFIWENKVFNNYECWDVELTDD